MKKLKLSDLNLGNTEVLSREQLKKVLGGLGSGQEGSGGECCDNQACPAGFGEGHACITIGNLQGTCHRKWCAGYGCNYYFYECE